MTKKGGKNKNNKRKGKMKDKYEINLKLIEYLH